MTIIYRETDPVSGRWTGNSGGVDLSAFQIDQNFFETISRVATLEANESFTVSIDYITISGNQLTFHMTNHTLQGPFTIPESTFNDRGVWAPFTVYAVNDTFNINGTLYLVIFAHTSAATFSAGANDGFGNNFYSAMLTVPGSSLPTGGATAQVLQKTGSADFAVTWGYKLPIGGNTAQILVKNSNTNQDASWETFPGLTPPPPSPAGIAGQVLSTVDGSDINTRWVSTLTVPPPSPAGIVGQVLASTGVGDATEWLTLGTISLFNEATSANYLADVAGKALSTDKVWAAADLVTLTDATTIGVDLSTFINAVVTLAGNRTLDNPTNTKNGQSGVIQIIQDGTGSRTLAYNGNWKFAAGSAPTLSTGAGKTDLLYYQVISSTFIFGTLIKDVR